MRDADARIARENPEQVIWVDSRMRARVVPQRYFEAEPAGSRSGLQTAVRADRLSGVCAEACRPALLFVTQGAQGVLVVDEQGETLVPAQAVDRPVDICGAGDSFSAGAGLALAITGRRGSSASGNLVASITMMKKGTGTASPEEVQRRPQMGW